MTTPDWREISQSAKAVVRGLLHTDPNYRMGISELKSHPWLADHLKQLQFERLERGNDANASKQDGFTLDVEPDANLLSSLNYLACCVNPHAAATQPTDGLCLYVSNGSAGDKKVATPPATVTVMLENGAIVRMGFES